MYWLEKDKRCRVEDKDMRSKICDTNASGGVDVRHNVVCSYVPWCAYSISVGGSVGLEDI